MAEPPDYYKCKKGILKNLVKTDEALRRIQDAVIRMNHITITTYQFVKAYYLYQMKGQDEPPTIDENFIKQCVRVVSAKVSKGGPPLKGENKSLVETLTTFYNEQFKQTLAEEPVSSLKLSKSINYAVTAMLTALENNIHVHFVKRLFRYVNTVFMKKEQSAMDALSTKERKEYLYRLRAELKKVKTDLISGKELTCDEKYHDWVLAARGTVVPNEFQVCIPYDVKVSPTKYLPYLIRMNLELEVMEGRQFHCFPLRSELVPKTIEIDTAELLELMIDTDTKKYRSGEGAIEKAKQELWGMFFKMDARMFRYGEPYRFDYAIKTDGVAITTRFVRSDMYGRRFKPKVKPSNEPEFKYMDEMSADELEKLKDKYRLVYVDPNKGNIVYCIDDEGRTFRYTRKQRLHETQRIDNQKAINKYKKEHNLKPIETSISEHNSKTCNFEKFMSYLKQKNQANAQLFPYYEAVFMRKLKLRCHINTKRSEDKLIRNIRSIYRENEKPIALMYGDCNVGKQMRHIISTPMIGMKRLLAKYFWVVNIDEFRTSCLDWRTEEYNENAVVRTRDGKSKKLHSVLVSTIPTLNSSGCGFKTSYQNRDRNSVMNIKKIVQAYLIDGSRPERYRRDITLPQGNPRE